MVSSSVTSPGMSDATVRHSQTLANRPSSQTSKQSASQAISAPGGVSKYEASTGVVLSLSSESRKMAQEDTVKTKATPPPQANSAPRQTISVFA